MVNDVAKPHKDTKAVFVDLYRFQYIVIKETVFRVPETYHGSPRDFRAWDFSVQFR